MLEYIGYTFTVVSLLLSTGGLALALVLRAHVQNWSVQPPEQYQALTIIAPHRGKVNSRNIEALLQQDYPGIWEVIFVTTPNDASLPQLQQYAKDYKNVKIVIAEDVVQLAQQKGIHRGQKNNNLIAAIEAASPETDVYVFVDADACPFRDWLRKLVAPFADGNSKYGVVTSARLYLPGKGFASWVQALWILVADLFYVGKYINIWGGGMAIPKAIFEKTNLLSQINGESGASITSHDNNINVTLREHGYAAVWVPDCVVPRYPPPNKETWLKIIKFTNRQVLQTWWSNKVLWLYLLPMAIKTPVLLAALVFAFWYPWCWLALLSPLIDTLMGLVTKHALFNLAPEEKIFLRLNLWVLLLPIFTPLLVTINFVSAPFYRTMKWSGIEYTSKQVIGYTRK